MVQARFRGIVMGCGLDAGIEGANSHRYRYFLTTSLINGGCPPEIIRIIRGDVSKDMVGYYYKPDFETKIKPEYLRAIPKIL
jgi:hypothetical protein